MGTAHWIKSGMMTAGMVIGCMASASAADEPQQSQEYLDQLAELREMVESRDLDTYELEFEPYGLERIVLTDRLGEPHVYHYMPFRIQNRISDATLDRRAQGANAYNEVLLTVADEFGDVEVDGTALRVDTELEHDGASTIVERSDLGRRTRNVQLSVQAFDENGTRFRLLDEVPGEGPQEEFNFIDEGVRSVAFGPDEVRDAIEEREGRRLLTLPELAEIDLPPYEGGELDEYGAAPGEAYGVIIFDRLDVYGDKFIVQIRGLSNKLRERVPLHNDGEMEDYFNTEIFRRAYQVTYERPGDEFYLDLTRFNKVDERWTWLNTFQRLNVRKQRAQARYFLENVGRNEQANRAVVDEFRDQYEDMRDRYDDQLFDLDKALGLD